MKEWCMQLETLVQISKWIVVVYMRLKLSLSLKRIRSEHSYPRTKADISYLHLIKSLPVATLVVLGCLIPKKYSFIVLMRRDHLDVFDFVDIL
jgi:hypothetical protein